MLGEAFIPSSRGRDQSLEVLDRAMSWYVTQVVDVDAHVRLAGGEDGGVDVQCSTCDRGGEPVAWYAGPARFDPPLYPNPYDEARVPTARTMHHLYVLAHTHVRDMHTEPA